LREAQKLPDCQPKTPQKSIALDLFPEKEFAKMISAGLIVAPLGRSLGGLGLWFESQNIADLLRLLRILGKGDLSVSRIYEGHVKTCAEGRRRSA